MKNKNILITGGAGFIGSHLVDKLSKDNNISIIDNLSTGNISNINNKAKFYNCDIRSDLDKIFLENKFDYVFHLAAFINLRDSFIDPINCMDINLNGTINLINNCKKYNVNKFIFSSTGGAIYDKMALMPFTENSVENPKSPYGLSKLFAEKYIKNSGISYVNLRYSNVYGPRQNAKGEAGVISIFIDNALNNKPLKIFGDGFQTRDFVYVNDVVSANILCAEKAVNKTYNISTNKETSLLTLVEILKEKFNNVNVEFCEPNKDELRYCKLSYDLIDNELYWYPKINIKKGIVLFLK